MLQPYANFFALPGQSAEIEYSWGRQNWLPWSAAEQRAARGSDPNRGRDRRLEEDRRDASPARPGGGLQPPGICGRIGG